MHLENSIVIQADPETVYALAAEVERWPAFLPHYRWVKILEAGRDRRLVEMAAHRDGIPVWWRAEQTLNPQATRIRYRHVAGLTAGMEVEWSLIAAGDGLRATIAHDLDLRWPLVGSLVSDRIVGPWFVDNIASKTLRQIKRLAEAVPRAEAR